MINGQFVADAVEVFAQQSIVIERPDDVFHHVVLLLGEVLHVHLLFQRVIERGGVAVDGLLVVGILVVAVAAHLGHFVVPTYVVECGIECVFALLTFILRCLPVFLFAAVAGRVATISPLKVQRIIGRRTLQCRIVVEFGIDVLFKFGQGHFQQLHLQHLLGREPL